MSKNRVDILFLWGLLLLLTRCIKENTDDCFTDAYALSFIYYGDGTTDIFDSKIETVQLYVFDTEGDYINQFSVSKTELNEFQGIQPNLEPGQYDVVCWGNVTGLSEIVAGDNSFDEYFLYSSQYRSEEAILNFDSLYYGRQTIMVPERGEGRDTVYFRSAHIKIAVFIEGLSTTGTDVRAIGDSQGWLLVRNVYTGYDFRMDVTGDTADMYPGLVPENNENLLASRFNLLRFKDENDIRIDVYNGNGREVYSLPLQDFMTQNNITVEGINEITIPIFIRFEGLNVHVSVMEWEERPVDPIV